MRITVKVRPEYASALQGREQPSGEVDALLERADRLGVSLEPVHPGERDPSLAGYFTVEVPDERAEGVLASLQASDAVEAAYVKPAEEPP